ncbi:class I SAM-dependent methyltransferase [Sphingomonas sp. DBB INV C78]|uniref:class I SAM-dependent methyltransferase n=1 Tax=Sphingomonas sp. DBB INV C78 TaxID=3349434 RepID=UPI0036D36760
MIAPSSCEDRLSRLIEAMGPIPISQFMAEANAAYYAAKDPLGATGDFITAPEISQMFGELIGLWLADLWQQSEREPVAYVELGPGRGTLAEDATRAMRAVGLTPAIHFVETSPALRAIQAERFPNAAWHDDLSTLPTNKPLLVVANEFFDALPIRQLIRAVNGWRERMIAFGPDGFAPVAGDVPVDALVPPRLHDAPPGSIIESSPASAAIARDLAGRIADQGGAALIVDYGYAGYAAGDTLQAVHAHAYADPFARPGTRDLTAHVDFTALDHAARAEGLHVHGPVTQGEWLELLGIGARAAALTQGAPARADEIEAARRRLTHVEEMGDLFKVMALTAPEWPEPAGFDG